MAKKVTQQAQKPAQKSRFFVDAKDFTNAVLTAGDWQNHAKALEEGKKQYKHIHFVSAYCTDELQEILRLVCENKHELIECSNARDGYFSCWRLMIGEPLKPKKVAKLKYQLYEAPVGGEV